MAYSCNCTWRVDWWHCGSCQVDATWDGPENDEGDCLHCDTPIELNLEPECSHLFCTNRVGGPNGPYCIHECDNGDEFLVRSEGEFYDGLISIEWYSPIPSDLWYQCPSSNKLSRPSSNCDCEKGEWGEDCWSCVYCECGECGNAPISMEYLCTPLSIMLVCQNVNCEGDVFTPNEAWPVEYYCGCCERKTPMTFDDDSGDFYCDYCEIDGPLVFRGNDGDDSCRYYDWDTKTYNHPEESSELESENPSYRIDSRQYIEIYEENKWERQSPHSVENALAQDERGRTYMQHTEAQRNGQIEKIRYTKKARNLGPQQEIKWTHHTDCSYATVSCLTCKESMYAKISNCIIKKGDWKYLHTGYGGDIQKFPIIEQVASIRGDFDKSDFNKGDFNKSDFNKGV